MGNLAIDVGNTKIKVGFFESSTLVFKKEFDRETFLVPLQALLSEFDVRDILLCTSGNSENIVTFLEQKGLCYKIMDHRMPLPFTNLYETPNTLGSDRIALTAAAVHHFPSKNALVIDAGTCITYDFKTEREEYLGGAISPGLGMRFNALHSFTSRLPLLKPVSAPVYLGRNTEEAIQSGVTNGIIAEINTAIRWYDDRYDDLRVIVTGGDMQFLSKTLKKGIFANSNFLLEGLNYLMVYNKAQ